jgi:DNA-binding CsgD family transcriptional regulator
MTAGGGVGDLVADIYDAAIEPDTWPDVFERVRRRFGAAACGITHRFPTHVDQTWVGLPESFERDYVARYHRHDPWARFADRLALDVVLPGSKMLPDEELVRTEFYNDLLRPHELKDLAAGILDRRGEALVSFALMPPSGAPLTPTALRAVGALFPHLRRATLLSRRLAAAESVASALLARFDAAGIAAIVVDRQRRPLETNALGDALLADGRHLRLDDGRIAATSAAARAPLEQALASSRLARPLVVRLGAGVRAPSPLTLSVVPMSERCRAGVAPLAHALLLALVASGSFDAASVGDALIAAYDLTAAEARIGALVGGGLCPKEAADRAGITEGTARFQLKQVYAKLGVDGQRGLVAAVGRLAQIAGVRSER